uniref:BED-type domain-containing protein n=1 Tax=Steinernema glaseri TaxID=37863 RepID=A0A1I7ZDU0_9BILA
MWGHLKAFHQDVVTAETFERKSQRKRGKKAQSEEKDEDSVGGLSGSEWHELIRIVQEGQQIKEESDDRSDTSTPTQPYVKRNRGINNNPAASTASANISYLQSIASSANSIGHIINQQNNDEKEVYSSTGIGRGAIAEATVSEGRIQTLDRDATGHGAGPPTAFDNREEEATNAIGCR